jgi:EmrB/QacA subfamily drug resistance transporter
MSYAESSHHQAMESQQVIAVEGRRWAGLMVLCAALFLEAMNLSSINVQIPVIRDSLQLSTATAQFVVSVYLATYAGFLLLGGRLADVLGRRRVFMCGVALFGLASLAGGLAVEPTLLVVARAVQGIGAALTTPAAVSIITTTFAEGSERNKAVGIYSMMGASGFAIGAVISGVLTHVLGWRWGFFDYVIIAALVVVLTPVLVAKDHTSTTTQSLDPAGALSITAGLLILVYAVGEANAAAAGQTLGLIALAIILLIVFVVIEARARAPMLPLGIFRSRTLVSANLVALTFLASFTGMLFISTLYLQTVLGYSAFQAGLVFVPMGIVAAVVSTLGSPRLVTRLGIKPTLVLGMLLVSVGIALTALISTDGTFWMIVLPSLLVGVGLSLAFPPMTIAAVTGVQGADQGLASSLVVTGQQLGGALGLALITVVAAAFTPGIAGAQRTAEASNQALVTGFQPALLLAAAFALLGMLIALVGIKGRIPKQPEQQLLMGARAEDELPERRNK